MLSLAVCVFTKMHRYLIAALSLAALLGSAWAGNSSCHCSKPTLCNRVQYDQKEVLLWSSELKLTSLTKWILSNAFFFLHTNQVHGIILKTNEKVWSHFNWTKLTTVTLIDFFDEKLICVAHEHNVRVLTQGIPSSNFPFSHFNFIFTRTICTGTRWEQQLRQQLARRSNSVGTTPFHRWHSPAGRWPTAKGAHLGKQTNAVCSTRNKDFPWKSARLYCSFQCALQPIQWTEWEREGTFWLNIYLQWLSFVREWCRRKELRLFWPFQGRWSVLHQRLQPSKAVLWRAMSGRCQLQLLLHHGRHTGLRKSECKHGQAGAWCALLCLRLRMSGVCGEPALLHPAKVLPRQPLQQWCRSDGAAKCTLSNVRTAGWILGRAHFHDDLQLCGKCAAMPEATFLTYF